ncbi:MAG: hypothetical protein AAGJ79_14655 [Verrucomicrobiota bacterium]
MQGPSLPQDSDADEDFELDLDFPEEEAGETSVQSITEAEVEAASEEISGSFGTVSKETGEPAQVPRDQPPAEDLAIIFDEEEDADVITSDPGTGLEVPPLIGEQAVRESPLEDSEKDEAEILRIRVGGRDDEELTPALKEGPGEDLTESLTGLGSSVGAAVTTLRKEKKVIIKEQEDADRELSKEIESIKDISMEDADGKVEAVEVMSDADVARLAGKGRGRKGMFLVLGLIFAGFTGYLAFNAWKSGESSGSEAVNAAATPDPSPVEPKKTLVTKSPDEEQPSGYKAAMESEKESPQAPPVAPQDDRIPQEAAAELRAAIEAYFSVEKYIDILEHCRDPERVSPLLKDYYEIHGWLPREVRGVEWTDEKVIEGHLFWLLEVQLDRFQNVLVLVEVVDDRYLVDWETQVYYNPVDWRVFVEQQPQGRFDMRVLATLHSEYKFPFTDDKTYLCVKLGSLQSGAEDVFGYAERGSATAKKIVDVLTGDFANESEYPLILTLEYPDGADGGDPLVHIRDFVAEHWIIVDGK